MEPNDNLDRLLDEALSHYGKPQPRLGLENRILTNLQSELGRRTRRRWWAAAVPVAVLLILGVWLGLRPNGREQDAESEAMRSSPTSPVPQFASQANSRQVLSPARAPAHRTLARKSATKDNRSVAALRRSEPLLSHPLSEEERLLAAYVSTTPPRELVSPAKTAKNLDDLEITILHVGKLQTPSLSAAEEKVDANVTN